MPQAEFETYFHRTAGRFSSFYRSESVARALGRGALFDRLRYATERVKSLEAKTVLDIGCGSGPLFSPVASMGVQIVGMDPAQAMVDLAKTEASKFPGLVEVRKLGWEDIDSAEHFDVAVALGVFDYLDDPVELLKRAASVASHVVASFPAPGLRVELRKIRYGARGVHVHGYPESELGVLAKSAGTRVAQLSKLGNAGFAVTFDRIGEDSE